MKKRTAIAGLLAVVALTWGSAASAQPTPSPVGDNPAPAVRDFEGVRYVTGGVGEGERARILGIAEDFNLKLLFAEKAGPYLADVQVAISRRDGRKVLELAADGPFLLAKLPPGEYRISATAEGQEQTRDVKVSATGQQALNFYW